MTRFIRNLWSDISRSGAFVFRDYHLTRRYLSWMLAYAFYSFVNSVAVVLIGVAAGDGQQTRNLLLGALMWSYLGALFHEIANSITYERWEGTIEYTFMAPVSRLSHLMGVSAFASLVALIRVVVVFLAMQLFVDVSFEGANLWGVLVVLLFSGLSFTGLGIITAVMPLLSPEKGGQATEIVGGILLLISGVYYPVSVLPAWLQPFAWTCPATYALNASRALIGISPEGKSVGQVLNGASIYSVSGDIFILVAFGILSIPLGLWIFGLAEDWAKRTGRLKRSG